MKQHFKNWNPKDRSLSLVAMANSIIDEYLEDGYTLTLRQLYYQFVARDIIENTEQSYKNLGKVITNARMAGLVSWTAIEDRNREYKQPFVAEDADSEINSLPYYISFDQWRRQEYYFEVWVEKEALGSVIEKACRPLRLPHLSCKGYLSASEAFRAGQRFKKARSQGKTCRLIHLGDHDPSGLDMTRDNDDQVSLFSDHANVTVDRIALNMDQIEEYAPPPNPAKLTDSRAKEYIKKYGRQSWELDALEPRVIASLIKQSVEPYIDWNTWDNVSEQEQQVKDELTKLGNHWGKVKDFLGGLDD